MLRFTIARLHDTKHKLAWNAFLESFAVHARNLQLFLTNDKDSRNYRAEHFNGHFRSTKPPVEIKDKVAVYIVHPGKARSEEAHDKFNLNRADKAFAWLESEFARFVNELPPNTKKVWQPQLANPDMYEVALNDSIPSACTHPIFSALQLPVQNETSHIEITWQFPSMGTPTKD